VLNQKAAAGTKKGSVDVEVDAANFKGVGPKENET
jgi:hypothetical protein